MANHFRFFVLAFFIACAFSQVYGVARKTASNRVARTSRDTVVDTPNMPYLTADELVMVENDPTECINVLANDRDHNLNAATLMIYSYPEHGTASKRTNLICYQPESNFNGWDIFSYSVCGADSNKCTWAEIRVYVAPVNRAPVANDDIAFINEDQVFVVIDVLANDYDVDGPFVNYESLQVITYPEHGTVHVTGDHKIVYIPNNFEGNRQIGIDHFEYQICDNEVEGLCSHASVGVSVDDYCATCENCRSKLSSFNDHNANLLEQYHHTVYDPSTVISP